MAEQWRPGEEGLVRPWGQRDTVPSSLLPLLSASANPLSQAFFPAPQVPGLTVPAHLSDASRRTTSTLATLGALGQRGNSPPAPRGNLWAQAGQRQVPSIITQFKLT